MQAPGKRWREQSGKREQRRRLREKRHRFPLAPHRPAAPGFPFIPRRLQVAARRRVLRPERRCTHLFESTTSRRRGPPRPPPGAGGTGAAGRPWARGGAAAAGRAGGAGRARPSAAGRSRAAAGSDTCRAPPPKPPRPLARPTDLRAPPRRASPADSRGLPSRGSGAPSLPAAARGKVAGRRARDGADQAADAAKRRRCLPRAGWSWRVTGERSALTKRALPSEPGRGCPWDRRPARPGRDS